MSPLIRGTLSRASAKYRSSIGGIDSNGATITFSAGDVLIFVISTSKYNFVKFYEYGLLSKWNEIF